MLATFVIEICLLVFSALKYKISVIRGIGIAILFFLATFQISEYFVCGGWNMEAETWSRIGYVAITLLPMLGIQLIGRIAPKLNRWWVRSAYVTGLGWAALFAIGDIFRGYQCGGNYVIFQLQPPVGGAYFLHYYAWLFIGIFLCFKLAKQKGVRNNQRGALHWLVAGYLVFLLPTTVVSSLYPETAQGIPSIMCGFAVIFAFILSLKILPLATKNTRKTSRKA